MGVKSFVKKHGKRAAVGFATGGLSETARAISGQDSIYDPALSAVGLGVDKAGPPPDAAAALAGAEATTAENLRRAYALGDAAGAYQTQTRVRDPEEIRAATVEADTVGRTVIGAPERVGTEQLGPLREVSGPNLGAAVQASGARIGPAELQRGVTVGQAGDTSGAAAMLEAAAMGRGTSKAEEQLRAGADKIAKKQQSMAAAGKGSERRGGRRAAMLAIGEQGAALNQQAAELRAGEMATARGAFAQYSQQAQALKQQSMNLQAQIEAAQAAGDQAAVNSLKSQQATIDTRISEVNAAAANVRDTDRATLSMTSEQTNAAAANARQVQQAAIAARAAEINAAAGNQNMTAQAAMDAAWREADAAKRLQASTTNATLGLQGQTTTAQMRQAADLGNIAREQGDEGLRTGGQSAALSAAGGAAGQQTQLQTAKLAAEQAAYAEAQRREATQRNARTQIALGVGQTLIGNPSGLIQAASAASNNRTGTAAASPPAPVSAPVPKAGEFNPDAPLGISTTNDTLPLSQALTAAAPPATPSAAEVMDAQAKRTRKELAV